jgi:hypothetical protein
MVLTSGALAATITATGVLPPSVTFTDNGNGTAAIRGTPAPGTSGYPLTITAGNGIAADVTRNFTLIISQNSVRTPSCS